MELFRTTTAFVILMGWFWEDIVDIFKNMTKKNNKEEDKVNQVNSTGCPTTNDTIAAKDDDVTDDHDTTSIMFCDHLNNLGDDLMVNILSRLPATTLMKCKSVSRAWRRMIIEVCSYLIPRHGYPLSGFIFCKIEPIAYPPGCDIFFCHGPPLSSHLHDLRLLNPHRNHLRAEGSDQIVAKSFISPLPMLSHPLDNRKLLDCCNGLLLFCDSNPYSAPRYTVCNPTTCECITIPGKTINTHSAAGVLAFDPSESLHYKVVLIPNKGQPKKLIIFSSETGRWTKLKFHLNKTILMVNWSQSVYFSGKLYKLSSTGHLLRIFVNRQVSKIHRIQSIDLPLARYIDGPAIIECIGLQNRRLRYAVLKEQTLRIFTLEHTGGDDYDSLNKNDFYWSFTHICGDPFDSRFYFLGRNIYAFHPDLDIIVLGYGEAIGHCFKSKNINVICYNYKIKKVQGSTLLHNKVNPFFYVFPFTRCYLPLARRGGIVGTSMPSSRMTATYYPTSAAEAPPQSPVSKSGVFASDMATANYPSNAYGQAATSLVAVAGQNLEQTIQQIMDISGGNRDKETVTRRASYNNPEQAADYLHTEILSGSCGGGLGSLKFLRNDKQFQALRSMVQANPLINLQELFPNSPQLLRLIQKHYAEFLRFIYEPTEASEG